jgi:DNA (cytosine-5)-methyltransferase 1
MYRDNWPNCNHLVVGDVHGIDSPSVPTCDLFTASFPCNDLSIAGRQEGLNGKESSAFWGLIRILKEMGDRRPPVVLLENVVGFLQSQGGQNFETALLALNSLGYTVDAFIVNAVHWVPQSRARLFVVAKRSISPLREPFAIESEVRPAALYEFIATRQNVKWDITELPRLPKPKRTLMDILEDLPADDPHWWDAQRTDYFMNQLSKRHEVQAKLMLAGTEFSYATAFRRVRNGRSMAELRTDGIAGCLRTPRGGSGRQILFKAGRRKRQVRLLTARECARLQGVPDGYLIKVPLNQALFGFGDGVCVPAVEWIIANYLRPLADAYAAGGSLFDKVAD